MIKVTMLVPKNYNDGNAISQFYYKNLDEWFVNKFGGVTVSECSGKYKMCDGTIAADSLVAYSVCCEKTGLYEIGVLAQSIAKRLQQECVYVEHSEVIAEFIKP
jgi:hypothetical protein